MNESEMAKYVIDEMLLAHRSVDVKVAIKCGLKAIDFFLTENQKEINNPKSPIRREYWNNVRYYVETYDKEKTQWDEMERKYEKWRIENHGLCNFREFLDWMKSNYEPPIEFSNEQTINENES
jgi:hypothetical protein